MNEYKHTSHSYAESDISAVAKKTPIGLQGKKRGFFSINGGGKERHSKLTAGHAIFCLHVLTHSMIRYVTEIHWDQRTQRAICL